MKRALDPLHYSGLGLERLSHLPQVGSDETRDFIERFDVARLTTWDMSDLSMPTDKILMLARDLICPNFYNERTQPRLVRSYAHRCCRGTSDYSCVFATISYASAGASKGEIYLASENPMD